MKKLILIFIAALTFSCASKKITQDSTEIKFGSTGGFTGMTNQYLIKGDGKVYKNSIDTINAINELKKCELKIIHKQLNKLDFENLKLNEKGNMTYFIEVKTDKFQNKISWSNQAQNDSINQFYKDLVKTLKK